MRLTYKTKLTLSFIIIFTLFAASIVIFEQYRARRYKTEALEEKLDAYADIISSYLAANEWQMYGPYSLRNILPSNLRITVIDPDGNVAFDNLFSEPAGLENHLDRPEISAAAIKGTGHNIRTSVSNHRPYLYYAKYSGNGFIRVALPYDIHVKSFLKPDNAFLYFVILLFLAGLVFIHYVGNFFGRSISNLRDFARSASNKVDNIAVPEFPEDELGEIGRQIAEDFKLLKESETKVARERGKLLLHIHISAEGICFFNPDGSVAFYNGLFLQYLNMINREPGLKDILSVEAFRPVNEYLASESSENYYEYLIKENGCEFLLRLNHFDDGSFEIVLNDISEQEKTRRLKREMTGNIAHELRTPVTSIRGYLETMLESDLTPEQQHKFTEKAHNQTLVLSELIRDMGLLTKIEESSDKFDFREIELGSLIERVGTDLKGDISANGITYRNEIPTGTRVFGNESLLYSVFRNLADNAIKHAGQNIHIIAKLMGRKDGKLVISFADTGKGIDDEKHLDRIFERFYRVDEGRTRDNGGSGLGLSIVKNALLVHDGNIAAGNRKEGGLEFIIRLPEHTNGK